MRRHADPHQRGRHRTRHGGSDPVCQRGARPGARYLRRRAPVVRDTQPASRNAMNLRRPSLVLLTIVCTIAAVACGGDDKRSTAAPRVVAAPDPWFMSADNNCGFDSTANHTDAEGLVREFVQRDEQGAFLRSDPW